MFIHLKMDKIITLENKDKICEKFLLFKLKEKNMLYNNFFIAFFYLSFVSLISIGELVISIPDI